MQSLIARRRATLVRDPAPSKWRYRYQRMMLTPGVRTLVRVGVPFSLIVALSVNWYSHDENRTLLATKWQDYKSQFQHRPEFMISELAVTGTEGGLTKDVIAALPIEFPVSSFDLNLEGMRQHVEALAGVRAARVRVGEAGALQVDVTPRVPVALWRDRDTLRLIDAEGVTAGVLAARVDRLDLPLIAGDGAQDHIAEALALYRAARPIAPRIRGLVRMGERRWDIVLDREQRILLPTEAPLAAVDRVIVLHQAQDMLDRDVAIVDMRSTQRPTLRMNKEATDALRRVSQTEAEN